MAPRIYHPLIIAIGLGISYWALKRRTQRSTLSDEQKASIALAAFIGAMLGAKIPFLLSGSPALGSWMWLADGKTILGGIFGGYIAVEITKRFVGIRVRTGDNFAVPVAIAVAAGRLGCFAGGCCFGDITTLPIGVSFPLAGDPVGVLRHPTQLYEVAFHTIALAWLLYAEFKGIFRGRRLAIYLASYLVFRFLSEWIRPEPDWIFGLTAYQVACIVLLAALLLSEAFQVGQSANSNAPA